METLLSDLARAIDRVFGVVHSETLGPSSLALVGLAPILLFIGVALAFAVALRWRPPAFLWWISPLILLTIGSLSTFSTARTVNEALESVDPAMRAQLAPSGYADAITPLGVALALSALTLAVQPAMLGIGAIVGVRREGTTNWGAAIAVNLLGVLGAVTVAIAGFVLETPGFFVPPVIVLAASFGVSLAGLRSPEDPEEAPSKVVARPAAAWMGIGAAACAAAALIAYTENLRWSGYSMISPEYRSALIAAGVQAQFGASVSGGITLLVMIGVALVVTLPVGPQLVGFRTMVGGIGSVLAMLWAVVIPTGAAYYAHQSIDKLVDEPWLAIAQSVDLPVLPQGAMEVPVAPACAVVLKGGKPVAPTACNQARMALVDGKSPASILLDPVFTAEDSRFLVAFQRSTEIPMEPLAAMQSYGGLLFSTGAAAIGYDPTFGLGGEPLWIVEGVDGTHLVRNGVDTLLTAPATWQTALQAAPPDGPVMFSPGARWTVQDIVTSCNELQTFQQVDLACHLGVYVAPPPEVPVEVPTVGTRRPPAPVADETDVKKALKASQGDFRYCYDARKRDNPSLQGRVELSIVLTSGSPAVSVVSDTSKDGEFTACLVQRAKRIDYPAISGTFPWVVSFQ